VGEEGVIMTNLFSSLNRWAHRQEENFFTEAFVFLLNHLLENETESGKRLLNWLCFDGENHFLDEFPTVSTQFVTDEGRPDVSIKAPGIFVLIEVKKGSGLGDRQLERYRKVLDSSDATIRRLVLLTAFSVGSEDRPDKDIRWSDVADWLKANPMNGSVSQFLVIQFSEFLKEEGMTIERVSWEYMNGVKAHLNLMKMVAKGLEKANIKAAHWRSAWEYSGFNLESSQFWVGVEYPYYEYLSMNTEKIDYDKLQFNALGKQSDVPGVGQVEREILENGKAWIGLNLEHESVCFFSLSAENQLKVIRQFLETALQDFVKCLVKTNE